MGAVSSNLTPSASSLRELSRRSFRTKPGLPYSISLRPATDKVLMRHIEPFLACEQAEFVELRVNPKPCRVSSSVDFRA